MATESEPLILCLNPACKKDVFNSNNLTCNSEECSVIVRVFANEDTVNFYRDHICIVKQIPTYRERFIITRDSIRDAISQNINTSIADITKVAIPPFRDMSTISNSVERMQLE